MDVRQNLLQFKMQLMRKMPFYGDILLRLPVRESKTVATAATDGKTILYNPDFFDALTQGEQNFVFMHEVLHVLLQHSRRVCDTARDRKLWNTACDLIVNNMLYEQLSGPMRRMEIPFSMPSGALKASLPRDTTVENLYARLMSDNIGNTELKKVRLVLPGRQFKAPAGPVEFPPPQEDLLPGAASAEEQLLGEHQLKEMIRNALGEHEKTGLTPGTGSYFIPPAVYDLCAGKPLDWRKLLRGMLDHQISDDTSYATPERKYLHMDLILPGHAASEEVLEEVWVFVDSSGSIAKETMSAFLTQVYQLIKGFRCTMNIVYWDTQVTDIYRKIRREKDVQNCLPHHTGGTNINCVYKWIRENKIRPDVMIILTDGYFGRLQETETAARFKRKSILLLSTGIKANDDMNKIGRIARLTE